MTEVKCPECGAQMEKGFIGAWYIYWSDKRREVFWRNPPKNNLLVKSGWYAKSREAYRCKNCELVLFNYGYVPPQETPESFLKNCVNCNEEIPIASDYCPKCGAKQKEG